jgi:signal transduction histidine kinase
MPVSSESSSAPEFFDVHPSVLFKLGEDLIRDDAQALAELIKNSYDADASRVRVAIDTKGLYDRATGDLVDDESGSPTTGVVRGRISVEDNGTGMDRDSIRGGWLTVSSSAKREMKAAGTTTVRRRTPLGDKGLGRLGAQRLGEVLELETVAVDPSLGATPGEASARGDIERSVIVDWDRFESATALRNVPIEVRETPIEPRQSGSIVTVLGLRSPDYWAGGGTVSIQRELMTIFSPYEDAEDLTIYVSIDGAPVDLRLAARAVLDSAPLVVEIRFDGEQMHLSARTKSSVLAGRNEKDRKAYRDLAAPDNGYAFIEWLLAKGSRAGKVGLESGDDRYFARFHQHVTLDDVRPTRATVESPGPFDGVISSLQLDGDVSTSESVFDSRSELRDVVRAMSGIRVYRDGFGIRLADDWLGLAQQQTSATSFYGLRPGNAAGYVNLTAEGNAQLEETSSREAFRDTPAWRGFYALMLHATDFARATQEVLRRGWSLYRAEFEAPQELRELQSPREIVAEIERGLEASSAAMSATESTRISVSQIDQTVAEVRRVRDLAGSSLLMDPRALAEFDQLERRLSALRAQIEEMEHSFRQIAEMQHFVSSGAALLAEKLETAEDQLSRAWESVALGLSAETFAHEVTNVSERLRGRSTQILHYLRSKETPDSRLVGYVDGVRTGSQELSRQASRIEPMLQFRRQRRERKLLSQFVEDAIAYHRDRWGEGGIQVTVTVSRDFDVSFNPGRFTQLMDNLVLNSEFWLSRDESADPTIAIQIEQPTMTVRDSGPGIEPRVATTIFDPFVSAKPLGEGRGLGLFIVRQLLDAEGATIELSDHRNARDRLDTFLIDFRAADQ